MSDIIQLLPDSVASQIAAGEVIQRPSSALKELLENSIDSGATRIQVILKDAGKSLIQVVDNGCGMSITDARMSFERHATSKIRKAEDLFSIRTMGFRGEALASIAAIAQVEMKTKKIGDETGTFLVIEGSDLKTQEKCSCADGTSISVRNLFFNIPARRNFLKSNAAETRHLIEEFQRVALAHPQISFSMHQDGSEIFRLPAGNLRNRIANIFGANYNERAVPVEETTSAMNISGFILKPEFAKRTRGEQYFFVNTRFIKDAYLNHAVTGAFEDLLPKDSYPSYFLNMDIDPAKIDVNIHPTKTEIKFEDERLVYSIMKATVKRALGKFSIVPSLDFEQETSFNIPLSKISDTPKPPIISVNKNYNPFSLKTESGHTSPPSFSPGKSTAGWEKLYQGIDELISTEKAKVEVPSKLNFESTFYDEIEALLENSFSTFGNRHLMVHRGHEILFIEKQAAQERIFYEQYISIARENKHHSQQDLFPQTIEFTSSDFVLLKEIENEIRQLGFDIREFGKNTYVIHGIPSGTEITEAKSLFEEVLEDFKHHSYDFRNNKFENIARSLARGHSLKSHDTISAKEIKQIALSLFKCSIYEYTPSGKKIFVKLNADDVNKLFAAGF